MAEDLRFALILNDPAQLTRLGGSGSADVPVIGMRPNQWTPLTLRLNTNLTRRERGADTPRSAHGPTIDESQSRPSYSPSPVVAQQLWM